MLSSLSIPGVRRLTALYATAELIDWCGSIALMLLVYGHTGSALSAGGMLVCKQIVPGLLTPLTGRLLDRAPTVRVVALGFAIQASAILAVSAFGYGPILFALAIGSGLGGTLTRASFRATVARTLAGDARRAANALLNATMGFVSLIGPGIGAVLVTATSPQTGLAATGAVGLAAAAVALISSRSAIGVPAPATATTVAAAAPARASAGSRLSASGSGPRTHSIGPPAPGTTAPRAPSALPSAGLHLAHGPTTPTPRPRTESIGPPSATGANLPALASTSEPQAVSALPLPLPLLLAFTAVICTGLAMDEPSLLPYSEQSLHAGAGGYGAILSFWGFGIIVGSLAFSRMLHIPMLLIAAGGTTLTAIGYLGLAGAPTLSFACAVSVIGGVGNGFSWVALVTAVQEATPENRQGQAASRLEGIATAGPAIGYVLGGVIADVASPRLTLLIPGLVALAVLAIGTAIIALRNPRGPGSAPVEVAVGATDA